VGLLLNGEGELVTKETEKQLKNSLLPPRRHRLIFVTGFISKPICISYYSKVNDIYLFHKRHAAVAFVCHCCVTHGFLEKVYFGGKVTVIG